ncbi:ATP-binding protein, partial [bacterium]|nr:ATP-binding protein [bacterium]
TLFALVPVIILLTAIIIYYLTRSALMPIQRMIETIHGASDRDLLATLDIPDSGKELRDLAISFNSMMERVDESFKAQSRFFNDVAHQLKTPLAVLKGDLETTLNRVRSRDEYEQVLESNLEEVDRMVKLVNRMLVLARFDAGQVELKRERMSAQDFLNSAEEEFRAMAEALDCALAIDCRTEAELTIDRDKTIRALAAVVENAVAHSVGGETVEISAGENDRQVCISIRDHGPGIPEAELDRVFERFYRGSTARGDGFGIGLSIARSIARLEGGDITAANASGGGALITFRFPRADGREKSQH